MRVVSGLLIVAVTGLPGFGGTAAGDQAGRTVSMRDKAGVMDALEAGDADALQRIVGAQVKGAEFGKAARLRVLADFAGSTAQAKSCVEESAESRAADEFALAATRMPCDLIVAGNDLLQGDIANWAKGILRVKEYLYPVIRAKAQVPNLGLDMIEGYQYDQVISWPRVTTTLRAGVSDELEVSWKAYKKGPSKGDGEPFVTVTVNGKPLSMMVDTGASASTVDSDTANSLGLEHVVAGYGRISDPRSGSAVSLGQARDVVVGSVDIHNLPILIGSTPQPVLGLNALMRLGAIRITSKALRVMSTADVQAQPCESPLMLSSSIIGTHAGLVVPLIVNDRRAPAVFDTGDNARIMGVRDEAPAPTSAVRKTRIEVTATGAYEQQVFDTRASVVLGPVRKDLTFETIVDTQHYYHEAYVVGAGVLRDISVLIDFRGGRGCFTNITVASNPGG